MSEDVSGPPEMNGQPESSQMNDMMLDRVLDAVSLLEAKGDAINTVAGVIQSTYETREEFVQLLVVMAGMAQSAISAVSRVLGQEPQTVLDQIRMRTLEQWSREQ